MSKRMMPRRIVIVMVLSVAFAPMLEAQPLTKIVEKGTKGVVSLFKRGGGATRIGESAAKTAVTKGVVSGVGNVGKFSTRVAETGGTAIKLLRASPKPIVAVGTVVAGVDAAHAMTAGTREKARGIKEWNQIAQEEFKKLPSDVQAALIERQRNDNFMSWMSAIMPGKKAVVALAFLGLVGYFGIKAFKIYLNYRLSKSVQA